MSEVTAEQAYGIVSLQRDQVIRQGRDIELGKLPVGIHMKVEYIARVAVKLCMQQRYPSVWLLRQHGISISPLLSICGHRDSPRILNENPEKVVSVSIWGRFTIRAVQNAEIGKHPSSYVSAEVSAIEFDDKIPSVVSSTVYDLVDTLDRIAGMQKASLVGFISAVEYTYLALNELLPLY